jgi:hypothetical protein
MASESKNKVSFLTPGKAAFLFLFKGNMLYFLGYLAHDEIFKSF